MSQKQLEDRQDVVKALETGQIQFGHNYQVLFGARR